MPWVAVRGVLTPCGWVAAGRVVADGDPMLVGCEAAFDRVDLSSPGEVEQATAAPGEIRKTTRRKAGE